MKILPGVQHGQLKLVHQDARRTIQEQEFPHGSLSVQLIDVKQRVPLGNHFHRRRQELFVLLRGSGRVCHGPVDDQGQLGPVEHRRGLTAGAVVQMPAGVAHAFLLEPGSQVLCYSDGLFEEGDMHRLVLLS